jgi:hypothetical protein
VEVGRRQRRSGGMDGGVSFLCPWSAVAFWFRVAGGVFFFCVCVGGGVPIVIFLRFGPLKRLHFLESCNGCNNKFGLCGQHEIEWSGRESG